LDSSKQLFHMSYIYIPGNNHMALIDL
jgi:hypothetical protein